MWERILGRKTEQNPPVTIPEKPKKEINYQMESGHAYILVGGKPEDIITNCDNCGGPFKGLCQPGCEYCSASRKVFYADITNTEVLTSLPGQEIKDMSFFIASGDTAEFADYTSVDMVIAEKVAAGAEFSADLVVAKEFRASHTADIGTLIIIDGGTADFGDETEIGTLVAGKDATLNFADYNNVGKLLKVASLNIKAGPELTIEKTQVLSTKNFAESLSGVLKKLQ